MKQAELELLIKNGAVGRVVIFRNRLELGGWQVFAYAEEGGSIPGGSRDWVELARARTPRNWSSLDTAHGWLRTLGWSGAVTVDG